MSKIVTGTPIDSKARSYRTKRISEQVKNNSRYTNKAVNSRREHPNGCALPGDPLELLMEQHTVGLAWLEKIAIAVDSIKAEGFSAKAFEIITGAVKYLGTEMHRHTESEEKYLFPLIDKHAFDSPMALRHERREMWQAFNELQLSVRDVEEGRIHGTTMRELLQSAQLVVERFRNQIEKENTIIFPMVKRLLTSDEYALLKQEITASI